MIAMNRPLGLREQVKTGVISLDEAIEISKDYNDDIQNWLIRRKKGNIKPKNADEPKRKRKKRKQRNKKRGNK